MHRHVKELIQSQTPESMDRIRSLVNAIVEAKNSGSRVVVCTGSGPNIHEGVTTLLAELIRVGIVDGILTSSAVIAHEMAGSLDRVHRVNGHALGLDTSVLPRDGRFEVTVMGDEDLAVVEREMAIDRDLIRRAMSAPGDTIIKAAGNMAYPMGLRTEILARDAVQMAKSVGLSLEAAVGLGADDRTMIGAAAKRGVPVLVSVPQLVGGGTVGLSIGDAISITERCSRIARLLGSAQVIIESGVALTQEIHDGPFETWTGHGIWPAWEGMSTYSLRGRTLARIDLDKNLELAWQYQRRSGMVQDAITRGLPKTKLTGIPFRMEMSGFARLETSLPLVGDIGQMWPIIASLAADALHIELEFVSAPQETPEGKAMRDWIVENVKPVCRKTMMEGIRSVEL